MAKISVLLAIAMAIAPHGSPQQQRLDTNGAQVDAHDGQLLYWNNEYVWIGTGYGAQGSPCYFQFSVAPTQWCGFKAYTSSTPAGPWIPQGTLFDPGPWQGRCGGINYGCFDPHEVYDAGTGRWVLWANVSDGNAGNAYPGDPGLQAWTATSPLGPFVAAGRPELHAAFGRHFYGSVSLFVDPMDGAGYAALTVIGGDTFAVGIEKLTPDYLNGAGDLTSNPMEPSYVMPPGDSKNEGPQMFERNGMYYVVYSDPACAYCTGTGTSYDTAPASWLGPLGHWTNRGSISSTSCGGAPSAVNQLPDGYIYQSDLWLGISHSNQSAANQHWEKLAFNPDGSIQPLTCTEWTG